MVQQRFVRQSSGFNPLADDQKLASLEDTWVCVNEGGLFRKGPSIDAELAEETLSPSPESPGVITNKAPLHAEIYGIREGDWLKLHNTGHYVMAKDAESGVRYFKNKKLILMEKESEDGPVRVNSRFSNDSKRSTGSGKASADKDNGSGCSVM
mmetsp:Transcript_77817/g.137228  ORF Transcript_77817/g.137228 Transcript_77817/m.137228 type:complete len:153 (-) Transcript_77817:228-686(-)|eukprot:CAMPEP_0197662534 /NCGR_PEP_ID=MMETSP1338-20131121/53826_1 /TAXON_ID=43686 ORGANISM="Pelagodinium beii, Strain RCC1491" /NCGR_SAMPLE_ID=MMETSP1338 /ASSEMBLY_ACC=CAM_ASM_000754 /LENGTH=152 /DNA_ID=CAMNT_0043240427 /DNA_START=83 /DNA_END=541 /DNA_ORIENTATION=+